MTTSVTKIEDRPAVAAARSESVPGELRPAHSSWWRSCSTLISWWRSKASPRCDQRHASSPDQTHLGLGAREGNPYQIILLDVVGTDNVFEAARLAAVTRVVSSEFTRFTRRLSTRSAA